MNQLIDKTEMNNTGPNTIEDVPSLPTLELGQGNGLSPYRESINLNPESGITVPPYVGPESRPIIATTLPSTIDRPNLLVESTPITSSNGGATQGSQQTSVTLEDLSSIKFLRADTNLKQASGWGDVFLALT
jgi:hypothetical protein